MTSQSPVELSERRWRHLSAFCVAKHRLKKHHRGCRKTWRRFFIQPFIVVVSSSILSWQRRREFFALVNWPRKTFSECFCDLEEFCTVSFSECGSNSKITTKLDITGHNSEQILVVFTMKFLVQTVWFCVLHTVNFSSFCIFYIFYTFQAIF